MFNYNSANDYYKVNFIFQNINVFISLIGIIGNVLVICLYLRRSLRKLSHSFYGVAKAVGDTFVLLYHFKLWSEVAWEAPLDKVNVFFCKANEYVFYTTIISCSCFLVLNSADRLVTIVYPNRFKFLKKRWVQAMLILIAIVIGASANIILPLSYNLNVRPNRISCITPRQTMTIHSETYLGCNVLIIFLINNALIIRLVVFILASRKKVLVNVTSRKDMKYSVKDKKFAISSIGLSFVAFVCKLPIGITYFVSFSTGLNPDISEMVLAICSTIMIVENSASFYVNLSLNSIFYDEFMAMTGRTRKIISSFDDSKNNNGLTSKTATSHKQTK